jgi:protein gp37
MKMAARLEAMGQQKYAATTRKVNGNVVWTGKINLDEKALEQPYRWRKPRMVFVNSMSDLFHEDVPFEFIDRVLEVIDDNPQHTFQVLTKRARRAAQYFDRRNKWSREWEYDTYGGLLGITNMTPANLWIGVSAEDNARAQERIPWLEEIRAGARFVSYEPALGSIEWDRYWHTFLDQIIVGAESGPNRRPFDMAWARDTRNFCLQHGIAFFMKQGSAFKSGVAPYLVNEDGTRWQWHQYPGNLALPVEVPA